MTALYETDVIDLLYLLGQGIDLTWSVPDGGHTSSLLTLAIFRDNDSDTYKFQASKDLYFPRPGVSLTYLLLQSLANPNIIPPKQQPTTMLELAVELGNSHLVQLLLKKEQWYTPKVTQCRLWWRPFCTDTGKMCNCYWMRGQTRGGLHPSSRCVTIHGIGLASCHAMNLSTQYKYLLSKVRRIQWLISSPIRLRSNKAQAGLHTQFVMTLPWRTTRRSS